MREVFDRGDVVKLECEGRIFAKGITDYTSEELLKIKGAHTNEIEGILGYKNYDNVIKKENIGILEELKLNQSGFKFQIVSYSGSVLITSDLLRIIHVL